MTPTGSITTSGTAAPALTGPVIPAAPAAPATGGPASQLEDILPLSPLQQGLYFHAVFDEAAPDVYTAQLVLELEGPLDAARLRDAAARLLARHPNLRASFRQRASGDPVQLVHRRVEVPWREVSGGDPDAVAAEERARRFDLARPPLLRFALVRLAPDRHRLVLTNHHILLDGWSTPLLAAEFLALYTGAEPPPAPPYKDYLAWLVRQDRAAAGAAWGRALDGLDGPTLVAPDLAGGPPADPGRVRAHLSEGLTDRLTTVLRSRSLTLNTAVQGAWALLLAQLTGRDDVVFGGTVSGRPAELPGVERMVGLFINTLPVRVRLRPDETLTGLLARIQAEQTDLLPHHHLGLAEIQRWHGSGALFDTMTVLENYPTDTAAAEVGDGLRLTGAGGSDATHYPLALAVVPGGRLSLRLDHRPDVFPRAEALRLLNRLTRLLKAVAADPDLPLARLDLLSADERALVGAEAVPGGTADAETGRDATLVSAFAEQAERTPDAEAVAGDGFSLTYAALNGRANRLAHLLAELGVGPETPVAVLLERSAEVVVATLAIAKAGGTYVPVHHGYPPERMSWVMADTGAPVLVTDREPGFAHGAAVVRLDLPGAAAGDDPGFVPEYDPHVRVHPGQLAYVIYTSGSTG
ncbi:condensation domain-containing protein, partial [Planomonospora venezuelensis]